MDLNQTAVSEKSLSSDKISDSLLIGWREWVGLPELGISRIKAKIDTGARTSVLHAFQVELFQENGKSKVRFAIHPFQYSNTNSVICETDLIDIRQITDSGGHREKRCVIQTTIFLGKQQETIEITLTSREDMRFRMLLGRTALKKNIIVRPSASYLLGKRKRSLEKV
jgi:hypothetical protein